MDKYIVPPRLNRKHIVYGFTVWELFTILFLLILTFFTNARIPVLIPIAAIIVAINYRPKNGDINARIYLVMLFTYFKTPQIYSLRECGGNDENQRNS